MPRPDNQEVYLRLLQADQRHGIVSAGNLRSACAGARGGPPYEHENRSRNTDNRSVLPLVLIKPFLPFILHLVPLPAAAIQANL